MAPPDLGLDEGPCRRTCSFNLDEHEEHLRPATAGRSRTSSFAEDQPELDRQRSRGRALTAPAGVFLDEDEQNEPQRKYPKRPHLVPQRDHPELEPPKGLQKCQPATCPHPHNFIGRGERDVEFYSEALERTVTPEAHTYFRRMVQVTRSELEKLLVYKIQKLLGPVSSSSMADLAVKELGTSVASTLQLPGVSAAAHVAELQDPHTLRKKAGSFRPEFTPHQKAVSEGEHLSKYLVGILGRILSDFGRFADTILRWQTATNDANAEVNASDVDNKATPAFPLRGHPDNGNFKELLERLERQDQDNSTLEVKNNSLQNDLQESRRSYMKEQLLWREQRRKLRRKLQKSTDKSLRKLLDHDVQFGGSGEPKEEQDEEEEEDVEEVKQKLQDKIAKVTEEYEDQIAEDKDTIARLREQLQAMQEKPGANQHKEDKERLRAAEETIRQLREEVETLRHDLVASESSYSDLTEQLHQTEGKLREALDKLSAAGQKPASKARCKMEFPRSLKITIRPEEGGDPQKAEEIAIQKKLADKQVQELEAAKEELLVAARKSAQEFRDKETQWELEATEKETQTLKLRDLLAEARPVTFGKTTQTEKTEVEPSDEENRTKELEGQSERLKDLLDEARKTSGDLEEELEATRARIKALEDEAKQRPRTQSEQAVTQKMVHKGGGFAYAVKKVLDKAGSSTNDGSQRTCMIEFQQPGGTAQEQPGVASSGPRHPRVRGAALNFKPSLEKRCVNFISQTQADQSIVAPAASSTDLHAVSSISLPLADGRQNDQATASQKPASAANASSELRSSYGGGFSTLGSTAWKGADRPDPLAHEWLEAETTNESGQEDSGEEARASIVADSVFATAGGSSGSGEVLTGGRTPTLQLLQGAGRNVMSRSAPDLVATLHAGEVSRPSQTPEQEHTRRPRPQSASSLPIPPRLTVLHGPPERQHGRPQSAVQVSSAQSQQLSRPQSAAASRSSRPQSASSQWLSRPQSAATQRPSRPHSAASHQPTHSQSAVAKQRPRSAGNYGSAIFDSHR